MPTRPPRAFTSGLPVHRVTPMTAGYNYGVTRESTPAGLSPASPSASFAALPPLAPAWCCSPASSVLSRRYDALLLSRRTSFPSLGGTSDALAAFALWRTSAPPEPGVGDPVSPAGNSPRSEQGSPKFLGNHHGPFAHVPIRRRQDCMHQTIQCSSVAPAHPTTEAPTMGSFDAQ
jgi:hypothetical protein